MGLDSGSLTWRTCGSLAGLVGEGIELDFCAGGACGSFGVGNRRGGVEVGGRDVRLVARSLIRRLLV